MVSTTIVVVELTHTPGIEGDAGTRIVNELLSLIFMTDADSKQTNSNSKPTPEDGMQSDDPGIETP